jgi:hypothetical protein
MTRKTLIATATAIFAAGSFATASHAQVKCGGINSCKGTSACKTASSACKGQNACKGQGWKETSDVVHCTNQGGKAMK